MDLYISNNVIPAICQKETHPYNQQWISQGWLEKYNIQLEAWVPLGRASSGIFDVEILKDIAAAHDKMPAQVMLRWLMQRDIIAISKSSHIERMRENIDVFDFSLTDREMAKIKRLDRGQNVDGLRHDDLKMIELLQSLQVKVSPFPQFVERRLILPDSTIFVTTKYLNKNKTTRKDTRIRGGNLFS